MFAFPIPNPFCINQIMSPVRLLLMSGIFCFSLSLWAQEQSTALLPAPDGEARKKARDEIKEVFDFDRANTKSKKIDLAIELLTTGKATEGKPNSQFELIRAARVLAAENGNIRLAMEATDFLASHFAFDADAARAKSLQSAIMAPNLSASEKEDIRILGAALIDHFQQVKEFPKARRMVEIMFVAAKKSKDASYAEDLRNQADSIKQLEADHAPVAAAKAKLNANPNDPSANATLGRFLFLQEGDWATAAKHLSQSDDAALADLAKQELQTPEETTDQVKLADGWWKLAESTTNDSQKQRMMVRAGIWYGSAVDKLAGLTKAKANHRLNQLDELGLKVPSDPAGNASSASAGFTTAGLFPEKVPAKDPSDAPMKPPAVERPKVTLPSEDLPIVYDGIRDARWASAKPIDLLKLVEPRRDQVAGSWRLDGEALISPKSSGLSRLRIPVLPPEAYRLDVDVVPRDGQRVNLVLSAWSGERFVVGLDHFQDGRVSGISRIKGKTAPSNRTRFDGQVLKAGQANKIAVIVNRAGIQVGVNGRVICRYTDDPKHLWIYRQYWEEPTRSCVVLGTEDSEIAFRSVVLTPIPTAGMVPYPKGEKRSRVWFNRGRTDISGSLAKRNKLHLDLIAERSFSVGWAIPGKLGRLALPKVQPVVFDIPVQHSVTTHGYTNGVAMITYSLDGNFSQFSAQVGISGIDAKDPGVTNGTLSFQVFGDGKQLARKDGIRKPRLLTPIFADVRDVKVLTLAVACDGDQTRSYATWVDPVIEK